MLRLPPYQPSVVQRIWDLTSDVLGVQIRTRLVWWPRREHWTISVWAADVELVTGRRLAEAVLLLARQRQSPPLPPGRLFLLARAGDSAELATKEGLGWTHILMWAEPGELPAPPTIAVEVT